MTLLEPFAYVDPVGVRWEIETTLLVRDGHEERVVRSRDTTPPPPTEADVAAAVAYFASHDPAAAAIPAMGRLADQR